ncbi:MAG: hypothetical protein AAFQ82_23465, partial [Myxococcota bacterium]
MRQRSTLRPTAPGARGRFALRPTALILALGLTALSACGDDEFGEGIRRPTTELAPRPTQISVEISEAFAGATPFVELFNSSEDAQSLDGFFLAGSLGEQVSLSGSLGGQQRLAVEGVAESVNGASAELAIVDGTGLVQNYVSWGGDPSARGSSLFNAAFAAGSSVAAPLSAPYPLDPSISLVFGDSPGCATPSSGTESADVSECPRGVAALSITEIFLSETADWIEIRNDGAGPISLVGARMCALPFCAPIIEASADIPAGGRAVLFASLTLAEVAALSPTDIGVDADATFDCSTSACAAAPALSLAASAELAVARPGGTTAVADDLLAYVRFGDTAGATLEEAAIGAGLWAAGSIENELAAGQSYH